MKSSLLATALAVLMLPVTDTDARDGCTRLMHATNVANPRWCTPQCRRGRSHKSWRAIWCRSDFPFLFF